MHFFDSGSSIIIFSFSFDINVLLQPLFGLCRAHGPTSLLPSTLRRIWLPALYVSFPALSSLLIRNAEVSIRRTLRLASSGGIGFGVGRQADFPR